MVNIWALDKDQRIRHVLLLLVEQLGETAFVVGAPDCPEQQAIWLQHRDEPELRVWLHVLGQQDGRYGVHLEYANDTLEVHDHLRLESLVEILAVHFDVPVIQPLP